MDMTVFMAALQSAFNTAVESAVAAKLAPLQDRMAACCRRVTALETKLAEAELFTRTTTTSVELDSAKIMEALNSQEWFWVKINSYIASQGEGTDWSRVRAIAEQEAADAVELLREDLPDMDDYVQTDALPDFDEFAMKDDLPDMDDYLSEDGAEERIRSILAGLTISASVTFD